MTDAQGVGPAADVPAIRAVAALDDDLRRGMYAFCRRARRPVTRDEAASEVGISRKLAAFHLDKLVAVGLLRSNVEPVGGVRKVGRRPKVYEPTETDVRVAIPGRRHDVLADILIDVVLDRDAPCQDAPERADDAARRVAHRHGSVIGARERERIHPGRLGAERALTVAEGELARLGFEPSREAPGLLRLRNCPFHPFAARAPELVCGLNQSFLTGFLAGLDAAAVRALLVGAPGECCVRLVAAAETGPPRACPASEE